MIAAFKLLFDAFLRVLGELFPPDPIDLMSDDMRKILSNREDTRKFNEAQEKIKNGSREETIVLHDGQKITLIPWR